MTRVASCPKHNGYQAGCPDCQRLGRHRELLRQMGRTPRYLLPADTCRLIRELVAQGHPYRSISAYSGVAERVVWSIASDKQEHVHESVASRIAFAYLRMRYLPGTDLRCVNRARQRGWLPPEDPDEPPTVDEIAIERAINGDRNVHLTRAEMTTAWQRLHATDMPHREIAARLGVNARTILRWQNKTPTSRRSA